jgi:hypothetical protein
MGGYTRPNEGDSVVWLTPRALIESLGEFDLDPCAAPSPRPWPTAHEHIELPQCGLQTPWQGRVWLNPPYTQDMGPWMAKMAEHGSGIALMFARTETELWQRLIWPAVDSAMFLRGRLYFHRPDGTRGETNSGAPSVLLSYSPEDTERVRRSGLKGALVEAPHMLD